MDDMEECRNLAPDRPAIASRYTDYTISDIYLYIITNRSTLLYQLHYPRHLPVCYYE